MKNGTKSHLITSSTLTDNTSITTQNTLSFQRILHRRTPITPRHEQSFIIMNTIDNDHTNDPLTRSILINNAARRRGFLPYDYRISNTFETIRRERLHHKTSSKLLQIPSSISRTATRVDAFGNLTNTMSRLAEQRLVLRAKSNRKQHNTTPIIDKQEKSSHLMSDADFATDIPNALEIMVNDKKTKSIMERNLLETMKRERLQQARYRLLPINRAPNS